MGNEQTTTGADVVELRPGLREFLATAEGRAVSTEELACIVDLGDGTIRHCRAEGRTLSLDAAFWRERLQATRAHLVPKTDAYQRARAIEQSFRRALNQAMAALSTGRCLKTTEDAEEVFGEALDRVAELRALCDGLVQAVEQMGREQNAAAGAGHS